jgi:hypothetical protein
MLKLQKNSSIRLIQQVDYRGEIEAQTNLSQSEIEAAMLLINSEDEGDKELGQLIITSNLK